MKQYPKINYLENDHFGETVWTFDKLDGSNIRAEFSRKSGWYKFGTRSNMIDSKDPNFGNAIPIFMEKYATDLENVFKRKYSNVESVVVFCEYLGENSFAGQHVESDKKDVILFDVNLYKKGFISPKDFIDNFGHLDTPKLIYKGEYNDDLIKNVKDNTLGLNEGVVIKGVRKTKGDQIVWMTKIKCNSWLEKVKDLYGEKYFLEEFK
jgi:hypothetical protein